MVLPLQSFTEVATSSYELVSSLTATASSEGHSPSRFGVHTQPARMEFGDMLLRNELI